MIPSHRRCRHSGGENEGKTTLSLIARGRNDRILRDCQLQRPQKRMVLQLYTRATGDLLRGNQNAKSGTRTVDFNQVLSGDFNNYVYTLNPASQASSGQAEITDQAGSSVSGSKDSGLLN